MPVMPVKSVPGCLVTMAPSVMGVPLAFWPLPRPHLLAGALLLVVVDPLVPPPLPHATAATIARELTNARAKADRGRLGPELVVIPLSPWENSREDRNVAAAAGWIGEKLDQSVWPKTSRPSRIAERQPSPPGG